MEKVTRKSRRLTKDSLAPEKRSKEENIEQMIQDLHCAQCHRTFTNQAQASDGKENKHHFCHLIGNLKTTLEIDPTPSPTKRSRLYCPLCPQLKKIVFSNSRELMKHMVLAHKAKFFIEEIQKQNERKGLAKDDLRCFQSKCKVISASQEDHLIHIGVDHEKLFNALMHDKKNNMKNTAKNLFPEKFRAHSHDWSHGSAGAKRKLFPGNGDAAGPSKKVKSDEQKVAGQFKKVKSDKTNVDESKVTAPSMKVKSNEQKVDCPSKKVKSDEKKVDGPSKKVKSDEKKVDGPSKKVKSDEKKVDGPSKKVKSDEKKVDGPLKKVKSGEQKIAGLQTSVIKVETPNQIPEQAKSTKPVPVQDTPSTASCISEAKPRKMKVETCDVCGATQSNKTTLYNHLAGEHFSQEISRRYPETGRDKERHFPCSYPGCTEIFRTAPARILHLGRQHRQVDVCLATFKAAKTEGGRRMKKMEGEKRRGQSL